MFYSRGKAIKQLENQTVRQRLINKENAFIANQESYELQHVSLNPPYVQPSTSTETTPLINKSKMQPMDIEDVEAQTIRKTSKLKTHLANNAGKYAVGAGIGSGIGAGVATMLHAGGQALADHVKDVKYEEWKEEQDGQISDRLAKQLFDDKAISEETYNSIINSNKFTQGFFPDNQHINKDDENRIAQQSADARSKIVKDYITYIDPIHTGWIRDYPHMGPGNDILPAALNELDDIARKHDIAYHKAKTWNDIYKADQEFIHWISHYTPDKWKDFAVKHIGKVGIQIKHSVEKYLTGVIYPRGLSKGK